MTPKDANDWIILLFPIPDETFNDYAEHSTLTWRLCACVSLSEDMFGAKGAAFIASPPQDGFAVANLGQRSRESCHPNRPALKARFTSAVTSFRALARCIDFRG